MKFNCLTGSIVHFTEKILVIRMLRTYLELPVHKFFSAHIKNTCDQRYHIKNNYNIFGSHLKLFR